MKLHYRNTCIYINMITLFLICIYESFFSPNYFSFVGMYNFQICSLFLLKMHLILQWINDAWYIYFSLNYGMLHFCIINKYFPFVLHDRNPSFCCYINCDVVVTCGLYLLCCFPLFCLWLSLLMGQEFCCMGGYPGGWVCSPEECGHRWQGHSHHVSALAAQSPPPLSSGGRGRVCWQRRQPHPTYTQVKQVLDIKLL